MEVEVGQFADIQIHAASLREWSQVYSQLTPGSLNSSLLQVRGARFEFFRQSINQRVVQLGEAPRGRVYFALPLRLPGAARMQGCEADSPESLRGALLARYSENCRRGLLAPGTLAPARRTRHQPLFCPMRA